MVNKRKNRKREMLREYEERLQKEMEMAYQHEAKCLCDEEKWTIKNVQDKLLAEESLHAIELKVENTFMKDYFSVEE